MQHPLCSIKQFKDILAPIERLQDAAPGRRGGCPKDVIPKQLRLRYESLSDPFNMAAKSPETRGSESGLAEKLCKRIIDSGGTADPRRIAQGTRMLDQSKADYHEET